MEQIGGTPIARLLKDKITYLLDDNGDPIEEHFSWSYAGPATYDFSGRIYHGEKVTTKTITCVYTYEFDPQGNWIKRVATNVEKKDGKSISTPFYATYRRIIYF